MRIKLKTIALIAAAGALALTVPAAAHPNGSDHPHGPGHPPATSHRCAPHNVAFIVYGTVAAGTSMTQDANATTWSGTLVVDVKRTNHWAKGTSGTYTITSAKVRFDGGTTGFSTGERVKLIGKLAVVRGKGKTSCPNAGASATPTIRRIVVHPAPTS
jgi:hypothetical protein